MVQIRVRTPRGKLLSRKIVRSRIRVVAVNSDLLKRNIAYLGIHNFQNGVAKEFKEQLEALQSQATLRGAIIDLRGNPGGLFSEAVAIADLFLSKGVIVATSTRKGKSIQREQASSLGTLSTELPLVVMINGGSASAAEIVAGALRDHKRAAVIGTRSYGKGSVQNMIDLNDGSGLKLTIARYYTPKGYSIHERGIEPDIVVTSKSKQLTRALAYFDLASTKRQAILQSNLKVSAHAALCSPHDPCIAMIIDDIGRDLPRLRQFLDLPITLNFALLSPC